MSRRVWLERGLIVVALLAMTACASERTERLPTVVQPKPDQRVRLTATSFANLPGWQSERHGEAIAALQGSCRRWAGMRDGTPLTGWPGVVQDFREICRIARGLTPDNHARARRFFETHFTPHQMSKGDNARALVTAYFEPILHGSTQRSQRFATPLYRKPEDLISVDLSDFHKKWDGEKIVGRVEGNRFIPYYARREIDQGILSGRGLEILWVDDPVDAFFLHIQGSGRVVLEDGRVMRVGYAGKNGHRYASIGRKLIEMGELPKHGASMKRIRDWIRRNPRKMRSIFSVNRSYIFFRPVEVPLNQGPIGAMQVPLTAGRSIAVDPKHNPLGIPIYLALDSGVPTGALNRIVIAQDTGGVIKGPIRGDFFWGSGDKAGQLAGSMRGTGKWFVLMPNIIAARLRPVS